MPLYRELNAATVPTATQRVAEAALRHGAAALGFALPPELRWCVAVTDPAEQTQVQALTPRGALVPPGYTFTLQPFSGLTDSRHWVLWLVVGLDAKQTAITVLHELAHLRYRTDGIPWGDLGSPQRAEEEAAVEAWAQAQYRRIGRIA